MWVQIDRVPEGLHHRDHAGTDALGCGLGHEFMDGLVGRAAQPAEQLAMMEEVGAQHLWGS